MPQPTLGQIHIDAPLTNISTAYIQEEGDFIANKLAPEIPVEKKSDLYYTYDKADWFRDDMQERAPGTESAGSGYNVSNDNYNCKVWALHKDISDQEIANEDTPLDAQTDAALFLTQRALLRQEKQFVTDMFGTGKWGTDITGGAGFTTWDNYAASNPIADLELGKITILQNTGFKPNTLALSYSVFEKLKHHPDLVDRIKYTGGILDQVATERALADLFGLKRVLVAMAVNNTAKEGQTGVYDFTHGKNALLCYVADRPGIRVPTAAYLFKWKGVSGNLGTTAAVKRFRMEWLASERVEIEMAFQYKIVGRDLGYFFSGAVA